MANWWRLSAVALAGLLLSIGQHIPLPGIDLSAFAGRNTGWGNPFERVSILALGLTPLYTALAFGEIGRLVAFRRHRAHLPAGRVGTIVIHVIAFALTGLQAYGIAVNLLQAGLVEAALSDVFIPLTIAIFVGATAVLILLTLHLRLAGLGSGFWLLWSIPFLTELPGSVASIIDLVATGVIPAWQWLIGLGFSIVSLAAAVFMLRLWKSVWWSHTVPLAAEAAFEPRDILVWPPVLAAMVTGYVLTPLAILAPGIVNGLEQHVLQIVVLVVTALLVPLFVFAYGRQTHGRIAPGAPLLPALTVIAVIQMLIFVSAGIVNTFTSLPVVISGVLSIVLAVVGYGLTERLWPQGRSIPASGAHAHD